MLSIIVIVVLLAIGVLFIVSRKPYAVSQRQFEETLVRVLTKNISEREWDNFVHITIGSDAYLDSLRERLLSLETNENSAGAEKGAIYNSAAMEQVTAILHELRSKKPNRATEPYSPSRSGPS